MKKILPNWMRFKGMNKWLKEVFDYCMDNSIDVVEHFNGLDEFDKERFLRGCLNNHKELKNHSLGINSKPYCYKELGWDKLEPIFEEFKVKGGETLFVKHFDGLTTIQRTKLLKGCVRMYRRLIVFRNGRNKWKVQFDEIKNKLLEPFSYESMWKIHSTHQQEIKKYKDEINSLKQELKGESKKIKSLTNNGCDGLIQRNNELLYRISYEEKLNRILKEKIKNFEELYSGGEVLENIL